MLLDISPLCLYHNQPMNLTEDTLHPRPVFQGTHHSFVCPVYGCNQRYDMKHGYYVMRGGAFEDATNKQPCPTVPSSLHGEAWRNNGGHSLALLKRGVFLE